ncbi:MAG: acyltransferase [Sphingobium sp.]
MRIVRLDALRGIAALMVLVQHGGQQIIGSGALPASLDAFMALLLADLLNLGRFGVALFFLISGFVIPFSFSGQRPIRRFALGRLFRLYPAYWLSLGFALIILWLTGRPTPGVGTALLNMTMMQSFLGGVDIVHVYWTLALELLFYAACASLFRLGLLGHAPLIAALVVLGSLAAVGLATLTQMTGHRLPANIPFNLALMFLGTLLRLAWMKRDARAIGLAPIILPFVVAVTPLIQCLAYWHGTQPYVGPLSFSTAYLLALALFVATLRSDWRFGRSWLWLGAISYALYLFHGPWLWALAALLGPLTPATLLPFLAGFLALSVGSAALVHHCVERPCLFWGKRMTERLTATPHPPRMASA